MANYRKTMATHYGITVIMGMVNQSNVGKPILGVHDNDGL